MLKIKHIRLIFFFALISVFQIAYSQATYVGELGLSGGISYYNGDVNSTQIFRHNREAANLFFRLRVNDYIGVKFDGGIAGVKGSGLNYPKNHLPLTNEYGAAGYNYEFSKRLLNVNALFCLNFFKYDYNMHDREAKWHTPYVVLGPGLAIQNDWKGNDCLLNLAFGVGYKFKIGPRVNTGVEWTMHKLLRDNLDNDGFKKYLDDPYKVGHERLKNNDYFSTCVLFVSFDLIKKRGICH